MPQNDELTCRLLAASAVSYWIERDGGLTACPLYNSVKYASVPTILEGGNEDIDAITVGSTTNGCVIVACRGTLSSTTGEDTRQVILDWINNLKAEQIQVPNLPDGCNAHDGFFKAVNLVKSPAGKNFFDIVKAQLAAIGSGAKLYTTGHSKGGAMSYIVAAQLIAAGHTPDAIISFAAARPGNEDFANYVQTQMSNHVIRRYEVTDDIVPHLPADLEILKLLDRDNKDFNNWIYESIGQLYYYDLKGNLEIPTNPISSTTVAVMRLASLTSAIIDHQFKKIADEHSLTTSYGPLICKNLPYGDPAIDAKDGLKVNIAS